MSRLPLASPGTSMGRWLGRLAWSSDASPCWLALPCPWRHAAKWSRLRLVASIPNWDPAVAKPRLKGLHRRQPPSHAGPWEDASVSHSTHQRKRSHHEPMRHGDRGSLPPDATRQGWDPSERDRHHRARGIGNPRQLWICRRHRCSRRDGVRSETGMARQKASSPGWRCGEIHHRPSVLPLKRCVRRMLRSYAGCCPISRAAAPGPR